MNQKSFKLVIVSIIVVLINISGSNAQTKVAALWQFYKKANPLLADLDTYKSKGSPNMSETCLSGDCNNGYGIAIYYNNGSTRYQYEGSFNNGLKNGIGAISITTGLYEVANYQNDEKVGGYLQVNDGLVWLRNANGRNFVSSSDEFGFTLQEVIKHQEYSFEKFSKCNCLSSTDYYETKSYTEEYTPKDRLGNDLSTETRTKYGQEKHIGLKNICDKTIYIKAISKDDFSENGAVYHDKSIAILPGYTFPEEEMHFSSIYNNNEIGVQYLGQYSKVEFSKNEKTTIKSTIKQISNTENNNLNTNIYKKTDSNSGVTSEEKAVNDEIEKMLQYKKELDLKEKNANIIEHNKKGKGGLGVIIDIDKEYKWPHIVKVDKGMPAETINLLPNDYITQINYKPTYGLSLEEVVVLLSGEIGSSCHITILRYGKEMIKYFTRSALPIAEK